MKKLMLGLLVGVALSVVPVLSYVLGEEQPAVRLPFRTSAQTIAAESVPRPTATGATHLEATTIGPWSGSAPREPDRWPAGHRFAWGSSGPYKGADNLPTEPDGSEEWVPTTVVVYGKTSSQVIAAYELKTGRFLFADRARGPESFIAAVTYAAGKTCAMVEKRPVVPDLRPVPGVRRGPLERLARE